MNLPVNVFQCCTCGKVQVAKDAVLNGTCCTECDDPICLFCGCTQSAPCLHENGTYPCSWKETGLCSFCFFRIVEAEYYAATGKVIPAVNTTPGGIITL